MIIYRAALHIFWYEQLSKLGVISGNTHKVGKSGLCYPFTRTTASDLRHGLGRRAVSCPAASLDFSCVAKMPRCRRIPPRRARRSSAARGEQDCRATWNKAASGVTWIPASWRGSGWAHVLADHPNSSADIVYTSVNCRKYIISRCNKNVSQASGKIFLLLCHYCQPKANEGDGKRNQTSYIPAPC